MSIVLKAFLGNQWNISAPNMPFDNNLCIIASSDPSQEEAIKIVKNYPLSVIQWPPGTGKSQTILNIIIDALSNNKKILVVCEKPAALKVIKKRLDWLDLGYLSAYIESIKSDRQKLISEIENVINNPEERIPYLSFWEQELQRILFLEQKIKQYNQFLEYKLWDISITDLHAFRSIYWWKEVIGKSIIKDELRKYWDLYDKIRDKELLTTYIESIKEHSEIHKEVDYNSNIFSEKNEKLKDIWDQEKIPTRLKKIIELISRHPNKKDEFAHISWLVFSDYIWSKNFQHSDKIQDIREWLSEYLWDIREVLTNSQYHKIKNTIESTDMDELENIYKMSKSLPKIAKIFFFLKKNPELTHIFDENPDFIDEAHGFMMEVLFDYLREKIIEEVWFEINSSSREIEDYKNELAVLIEKQRKYNKNKVKWAFKNRVSAAKLLRDHDKLAKQRSKNRQKATLRDIYTFESPLFKSPVVFEIFPVLLATPDVACSILELKENIVDYVIIDEASQMFVDLSLPIIYRWRKLVISGDENQMPPSNFFQNQNSDFDEEDETINAPINEESLLEAGSRAVSPELKNKCRLKVHYRSDHKALIEFSNHAFYDGTLISPSTNQSFFSSVHTPIIVKEIKWNYFASKNEAEAEEVIKTLKEIWLMEKPPSLGIIVFNDKQKNLIEDLLSIESSDNPDFWMMYERERNRKENGEHIGFFIRSVEHVQWDERDIIILWTVYWRESRQYWPIIKHNWRKRLNVAITRAKKSMIVVTSLDISNISNDGMKDQKEVYYFWKFMEYARHVSSRNKDWISRLIESLSSQPIIRKSRDKVAESPFEEDVAKYLRSIGYYVEHQVSEDEFRIDMGIKIKPTDELFICWIECDGRLYHSSWEARHNDIWRQWILESKWWKIVRIWGDEWYGNNIETKKKILNQITHFIN